MRIVMYMGHPYYLVDIQENYNTAFLLDIEENDRDPKMVNLSDIEYVDPLPSEDYVYLLDDDKYEEPLNRASIKYVEKVLNCDECLISLKEGGLYTMSVETADGEVIRFSISVDGYEDGNVDF